MTEQKAGGKWEVSLAFVSQFLRFVERNWITKTQNKTVNIQEDIVAQSTASS